MSNILNKNKPQLFSGKVKVLQTPITERYCRPGDIATLDLENNQIRCGDAWFKFDERWIVESIGIDPKYIRYEKDPRKWAPNAIRGIYIYVDENGKEKEKYDLIGCAFLGKERGDKYTDLFVNYLNSLVRK